MKRIAAIAATVLMAGCATNYNNHRYADMHEVLVKAYGDTFSTKFSEPDRSNLIECVTQATLRDVPLADQQKMLALFNGAPADSTTDPLFDRWLGYKWSDLRRPGGPNEEFVTRLRANYEITCPDLYAKYPNVIH